LARTNFDLDFAALGAFAAFGLVTGLAADLAAALLTVLRGARGMSGSFVLRVGGGIVGSSLCEVKFWSCRGKLRCEDREWKAESLLSVPDDSGGRCGLRDEEGGARSGRPWKQDVNNRANMTRGSWDSKDAAMFL